MRLGLILALTTLLLSMVRLSVSDGEEGVREWEFNEFYLVVGHSLDFERGSIGDVDFGGVAIEDAAFEIPASTNFGLGFRTKPSNYWGFALELNYRKEEHVLKGDSPGGQMTDLRFPIDFEAVSLDIHCHLYFVRRFKLAPYWIAGLGCRYYTTGYSSGEEKTELTYRDVAGYKRSATISLKKTSDWVAPLSGGVGLRYQLLDSMSISAEAHYTWFEMDYLSEGQEANEAGIVHFRASVSFGS